MFPIHRPNAGGGRDEMGEWLLGKTRHQDRVQGRRGPWVRHAYTSTVTRGPWMMRLPEDRLLAVPVEPADTIRDLLLNLDAGQRLAL